jgi:2-iminobutanoate/2-iminopropanoate deaminase
MSREIIDTPLAPRPVGPYSQAVRAGGVVWCAGQIGLDPATGILVAGGTLPEFRRAVANLEAVLAAVGLSLRHVVKTTIFLADIGDGPTVNAAYAEIFPAPYPARSTVQVSALPAGGRIEIDAIAVG